MPRLFVAVWPPDDVLDAVAALGRPSIAGLRWTTRDQWHVTLRFLGQVADAGDAVAALAGLAGGPGVQAAVGPATARFGHRILHLPVRGFEELAADAVRATAHVGQAPEDRPFAGHLTLARVAKGADVDLRRLAGTPIAGRWTAHEICLVESHLSPAGARYEVPARVPISSNW